MSSTWKKFPLQELTENNSPITYGVVKPGEVGNVLFIRGGDLANGRILSSQLRTITHEVSKQYERTVLRGGELLISLVGQPGQVAVVPSEFAGSNIARQVGLIRLRRGIDANFICYFLQSPDGRKALGKYTGGSVQQVINLCDLRMLSTPNPSLSEQKRIVAIVDHAFEAIDGAIENTKQNLVNARELLSSYLDNIFSDIASRCVAKPIISFSDVVSGYSFKSSDFSESNSIKSIKITNVGVQEFIADSSSYLPQEFSTSYKKFTISKGSIVIALTRSVISAGLKVSIVSDEYHNALLNQRVAAIKSDSNIVSNEFLFAYLCTGNVIDYVQSKVNTLMQPNLSINDLKNMPVPVPSLAEQNQLIFKIKELSTETQRLESIYRQKLAALTELKQSILQKAFTGELTADQKAP